MERKIDAGQRSAPDRRHRTQNDPNTSLSASWQAPLAQETTLSRRELRLRREREALRQAGVLSRREIRERERREQAELAARELAAQEALQRAEATQAAAAELAAPEPQVAQPTPRPEPVAAVATTEPIAVAQHQTHERLTAESLGLEAAPEPEPVSRPAAPRKPLRMLTTPSARRIQEKTRQRTAEQRNQTRALVRAAEAQRARQARRRMKHSVAIMAVATAIFGTFSLPAYAVDPVVAATVDLEKVDGSELLAVQEQVAAEKAEDQALEVADEGDVDADAQFARDEATANSPVATNSRTTRKACQAADPTGESTVSEVVFPLPEGSYYLSSRMGPRWGRLHAGDDYAAAAGTAIVAAAAGTVRAIGFVGSNPYVEIVHELADGTQWVTSYLHMPPSSIKVKVGDHVLAGQQIASVGSVGNSTGNHLHFEVHKTVNGVVGKTSDAASVVGPLNWLDEHGAAATPGC